MRSDRKEKRVRKWKQKTEKEKEKKYKQTIQEKNNPMSVAVKSRINNNAPGTKSFENLE